MFDGAIPAQKALSCIYRTSESFQVGINIIDALLGFEDERIAQFGHDRISTLASEPSMTIESGGRFCAIGSLYASSTSTSMAMEA